MSDRVENSQDDVLDKNEQIQRFIYRLLPFWPFIIVALIIGYIGAKIYLRYQMPIYSVKARMIVNDQTEQKSANLQEILKIDTKNLTSETEKEIQILSSKDLLTKVANKMQLNVTYSQKGRILTKQFYGDDLPFYIEMESPDSVKNIITGMASLVDDKTVKFGEEVYPVDSLISSQFGNIRWRRSKNLSDFKSKEEYIVTIRPLIMTVNNLKSSIRIEPISKQSSILDVSYLDEIPARAVAILNNLIYLYGTSAIDYKSRIYQNSQVFLDKRLNLIADELSGVEKDLEKFKSSQGIVDLSSEGVLYLNQVKEADKKISEIDIQLDILNQISQYINKRNNSNDQIPATLGIEDPVLTSLLTQLYQAESELQKTIEISGTKNPQVDVYEEAIKKLKSGIITSINNLKLNMLASKKRLEAENSKMSGLLNRIPLKERLLLDISRQQEIKNAIYTFLLQKREEAAIAAASIVANYRVIEKPEKVGIVSPQYGRAYTLSILLSIFLLTIYIYFKEFSSKKVLFRSQMEEYLPIPVISELIYYDHNLNNPVVVGEGKRTLIAEQFRELRTNINFITASVEKKCKVILTTSSIPKEGKSFVAINAAISLSLTGDKVVLIEFDMRKPKISKPLGINSDTGLSNFLVGQVTAAEIVKPHSTITGLFVIPSGPVPPNPAEIMKVEKLNELFYYLRENFDYVLIDSPPIAAVTDAKILSPLADATLYIVRHNYTNFVFLNLINDVYKKGSLKNIYVVFNGIKNKKILGYGYGGYGYGYGYGYNYGYGYTVEDKDSKPSIKKLIGNTFKFFSKRKMN